MLDILPCKCGRKPTVCTRVSNGNFFKITCNSCCITTVYFSKEEDAVDNWNSSIKAMKKIDSITEDIIGYMTRDCSTDMSDLVGWIKSNPDKGIRRTQLESEWVPLIGSSYKDDSGRGYTHYCSICKGYGFLDYLFCPGCGAEIIRR